MPLAWQYCNEAHMEETLYTDVFDEDRTVETGLYLEFERDGELFYMSGAAGVALEILRENVRRLGGVFVRELSREEYHANIRETVQ